MTPDPPTYAETHAGTWREIDALLEQIAQLARTSPAPDSFYPGLLDRTVRALAALGGAVWLAGKPGQLDLHYQIQLDTLQLAPDQLTDHHHLVARTVAGGVTRSFPPQSGFGDSGPRNPTDYLLVICPLLLDQELCGAVEIIQRPTNDPETWRGNERLLGLVGELALDYLRQRRMDQYRERVEWSEQLEQFAGRVHRPLDPDRVASEIANEARRLLDCDRVSVTGARRGGQRLLAVSGVELFDRRSNVARWLERLASRVCSTGEPLWFTGDWSSIPPQLESDLRGYLDESHVRTLAIIPLGSDGPSDEAGDFSRDRGDSGGAAAVGGLIVERMDAELDAGFVPRLEGVTRHAGAALRNASEYGSLPLLSVSRAVRQALRQLHADRLPRTLAATLAGLGLLIALTLIPAPFRIRAEGQLQPERSRYVFAAEEGVVEELGARQDQPVEADQVLLRLVNPELDLELERVETERLTTNKQLESIGILRVTGDDDRDRPETRADQLSARELETAQLLRSQQEQIRIIQRRQANLLVRSPIAGRLLTWDVDRLLSGRPVQRGELLLRVADLEGPWLAELEVPDSRIGHLRAAWRQRPELPVSFLLVTDPGTTYRGTVIDVDRTAHLSASGQAVVRVKVRVDDPLPRRHPGATVLARIHCGHRSLGYVWLHDLIDTVRSRLLF